MTVETEPGLTITVESTEVSSLREGDLLHIAFPAPQYRVLSNMGWGRLLTQNCRSTVTLVDSEGVEKQFLLSPRRKVERVTNPAIPVGPWFFPLTGTDISGYLRLWQREDAQWYKVLWPLAKPFVHLWRGILDLQCRAYSLKLQAGFLSVLIIILAVVIGLLTGTPDELSVPIGVVGAFSLERFWGYWNAKTRRKLAKGTSLRVRYKPYGPERLRYGTLELRKKGAIIVGGRPGQVWFTTEMALRQGELVLGTCAFANDIRDDLRYTTSAVAVPGPLPWFSTTGSCRRDGPNSCRETPRGRACLPGNPSRPCSAPKTATGPQRDTTRCRAGPRTKTADPPRSCPRWW